MMSLRSALRRPSATHQNRSLWSQAQAVLRDVFQGDDHVNPKKILERRYIYAALLATHVRGRRVMEASSEDAAEHVIDELDQKGVDRMSNVQLRHLMQETLEPQVCDIFEALGRVDRRLQSIDQKELMRLLESDMETQATVLGSDEASSFGALKREAYQVAVDYLREGATAISPSSKRKLDVFGFDSSLISTESLPAVRWHQAYNLARASLIQQELGYAVVSLRSLIPSAGRGTFVTGQAPIGSIVSFQPGDVWPKEHLLTTAPEVMEHFEGDDDDCQITLRFDDTVIDSRESPITVLSQEGSMNPFALGHMVNHPPAETMPNCQTIMLDYTQSMVQGRDGSLEAYIPNTYAKPPTWQSRLLSDQQGLVVPGLALLARRDIENEELVCDYRLQTSEELLPDWYHIVKYDEDFDKLDQKVFFHDDWRESEK